MSQQVNNLTDEQIAQLVQKGEIEPFGVLVERYEAKIKRYARKFLFNYNDADDLVQEVLIKAYTNIQSFDSDKRFSPWLYRIAHNEFINAIKKQGREPLPFFDPDVLFPHPVAKQQTDDETNANDLRKMLDQCLNQLSSKYREPLVLNYFEDQSYKEIADILHIPIATVGVRLRRGKQMIKNMIKKLDKKYE